MYLIHLVARREGKRCNRWVEVDDDELSRAPASEGPRLKDGERGREVSDVRLKAVDEASPARAARNDNEGSGRE